MNYSVHNRTDEPFVTYIHNLLFKVLYRQLERDQEGLEGSSLICTGISWSMRVNKYDLVSVSRLKDQPQPSVAVYFDEAFETGRSFSLFSCRRAALGDFIGSCPFTRLLLVSTSGRVHPGIALGWPVIRARVCEQTAMDIQLQFFVILLSWTVFPHENCREQDCQPLFCVYFKSRNEQRKIKLLRSSCFCQPRHLLFFFLVFGFGACKFLFILNFPLQG